MLRLNNFLLGVIIVSMFSIAGSGLVYSKSEIKPASTFEYNGPSIAFEDVFQNPDDNVLRLNYARQQASLGDFISAAHALEGMLYANPNWDTARLFYAILLVELDDRAAAIYEFNILMDRPLSAEHKSIVKAYLKKMGAKGS